MGGYGSGRPATSPTIEGTASLALDVNRVMAPMMRALRRHGMAGVPEGQTVTLVPLAWSWTRVGKGEPWAEVRVALTLGPDWGEAVLSYDIDHLTCPTGPQRETVRLVASPYRFGGVRWPVDLPGDLAALRQALSAQWRAAVPEPGRLSAGRCLSLEPLSRTDSLPMSRPREF